MNQAFICDAVRTPIGRFGGSLSSVRADDLAAIPIRALLERNKAKTVLGGTLSLSRSPVKRQNVVGGALFGIGWALSGTCPAPALVMLASGAGLAIITIIGLFIGLGLRDAQTSRATGTAVTGDGEHRETVAAR